LAIYSIIGGSGGGGGVSGGGHTGESTDCDGAMTNLATTLLLSGMFALMSATASLRYSLLSKPSPGRQSILAVLCISFQMALDSAEDSPEELFDQLRLRLLTLLLLELESLLKVVLPLLLRWW